ncbi:MAG: hypothetical protein AB1894_09075, partial [Chloroflexota bacterium]
VLVVRHPIISLLGLSVLASGFSSLGLPYAIPLKTLLCQGVLVQRGEITSLAPAELQAGMLVKVFFKGEVLGNHPAWGSAGVILIISEKAEQ